MSYFSHSTAAERYSLARPRFHPIVLERIRERLKLDAPVERALDIACGTGQSTTPLQSIARHVIGSDRSIAMLAEARRQIGFDFVAAGAEQQPFASASLDLITVALAFHWFDRAAFLNEVRRLLRPNGWLVIYNNSIYGRMGGNPGFEDWFRNVYISRYPSPPRNRTPITGDHARQFGFALIATEEYSNDVEFDVERFAAYLMTQTNVIAAVEEGVETIEQVQRWLISELQPWFSHQLERFEFGGPIWFLQREG